MYGAILGDIVGSPYEFDCNNYKGKDFPLFSQRSEFTDDTVMTLAVARALLDTRGQDDITIKAALVREMQRLGRAYPDKGYGVRFNQWLYEDDPQPYRSYGNGSAMRVSPAAWLAESIQEALHLAQLTAEVTHDHPEGIKGAQAVAAAIFLARTGHSKVEIKAYVECKFGYDLSRTCDEIRPTYHHVESCQETVPQAIAAFWESTSFEVSSVSLPANSGSFVFFLHLTMTVAIALIILSLSATKERPESDPSSLMLTILSLPCFISCSSFVEYMIPGGMLLCFPLRLASSHSFLLLA